MSVRLGSTSQPLGSPTATVGLAPSSSSSSRKQQQASTALFTNEFWTKLHYTCSREDVATVKAMLIAGCDANFTADNLAVPNVTALHIAVRKANKELVQLLLPHCNINAADQWGFTPLHYATVGRQKDLVMLLLGQGAAASAESASGCTARDIAEALGFEDIIDALTSKINLEKDPTVPQFRSWLTSLGGGEYLSKFIDAGYDLPFIAKQGLTDEDMDCVGIPASKRGLRRKIMGLHELDKFYEAEEEEEEDE